MRWAGGKSWLIKYLNDNASEIFSGTYHEPFLGGGSIFFHLKPQNAILSDANGELIRTYEAIKRDVNKVISELAGFENTESCYYQVRSAKYRNDYKLAARFIFLNKTSFNGIYRVNLKGIYNVPYGYRSVPIFDRENLLSISRLLQNVNLFEGDFSSHGDLIKKGDFIFLDPPYTVTHNNNGFIKYNQKLFSIEDQKRLSGFIDIIRKKKAFYFLTNAAHSIIDSIFDKGDFRVKIERASLIGGKKAVRGRYEEYIFTNLPAILKDTTY